ncbi:TPA: 1-phosphofructokinase [Streptococcus suis]
MIYTLTLNPSIDYVMSVENLTLGSVNRSDHEALYPGGKGINVSRILKRINQPTQALGFIAGFSGNYILDYLQEEGVDAAFIPVQGNSRINVKIKGQEESEINGKGPVIQEGDLNKLFEMIDQLDPSASIVFAGSANPNLGNQIYMDLIRRAKDRGLTVACDFEGQTLVDAIQFEPLLIKPNNHELGAIFGTSLTDRKDIVHYAKKLMEKGAQNVLVSMAGDGAILVCDQGAYWAKPIKGQVANSVGAGDSMVAGFMAAYQETKDPIEALKLGVACGTATAFSPDLASAAAIAEILKKVEVESI